MRNGSASIRNQGIQKSNLALRKIPIVGRDARTIDHSSGAEYDGTEGLDRSLRYDDTSLPQ